MKYLIFIALALLAFPACAQELKARPAPGDYMIDCTEELMLCPDGSSVGRDGPNCEFAPCPRDKADGVVSHEVEQTPEEIKQYWTPERMKNAKPMPMGRVVDRRTALATEIRAMITDLSCQVTTDCLSIGFGSRACGGYQQFIIYSALHTDSTKLQLLADDHYRIDKQYNLDEGIVSICSIEAQPVLTCYQGRCKAKGFN